MFHSDDNKRTFVKHVTCGAAAERLKPERQRANPQTQQRRRRHPSSAGSDRGSDKTEPPPDFNYSSSLEEERETALYLVLARFVTPSAKYVAIS